MPRSYLSYSDIPVIQHGSFDDFNEPRGLAWTSSDLFILGDYGNNRIRIFDKALNCLSNFASEGSGPGELARAMGLTVDKLSNNDIVVADTNNARVQIFSSQGQFLAQFGTQGSHVGELQTPYHVAVDRGLAGYFVTDAGNHRVQFFDRSFRVVSTWGTKGTEPGQLEMPFGIGQLSNREVVVSDFGNRRLQVFDPFSGRLVRVIGQGRLTTPCHLHVDEDDNILVADSNGQKVTVFSKTGEFIRNIGQGHLHYPTGITMDLTGRIIVSEASMMKSRISIFQ